MPCAGASRPTIERPVGKGEYFGRTSTPKVSDKQHAGYCMGKQSQIIIFRVVSRRPDLGRYLRLIGLRVWDWSLELRVQWLAIVTEGVGFRVWKSNIELGFKV